MTQNAALLQSSKGFSFIFLKRNGPIGHWENAFGGGFPRLKLGGSHGRHIAIDNQSQKNCQSPKSSSQVPTLSTGFGQSRCPGRSPLSASSPMALLSQAGFGMSFAPEGVQDSTQGSIRISAAKPRRGECILSRRDSVIVARTEWLPSRRSAFRSRCTAPTLLSRRADTGWKPCATLRHCRIRMRRLIRDPKRSRFGGTIRSGAR